MDSPLSLLARCMDDHVALKQSKQIRKAAHMDGLFDVLFG